MKRVGKFIFITLASAFVCKAAVAADLFRYKFTPGEELVYSGSSDFNFNMGKEHYPGAFKDSDITRFWVTGQNQDGSWHLIFIGQDMNIRTGRFASTNDTISCGHLDLSDDGRRVDKPAADSEEGIYPAFFPLPADASQAQSGWSFAKSPGVEATYHILQTGNRCTIESLERGIFYDIYQIGASNTIYFNNKLGLVEKIQGENEQGYGFTGHGTRVVELESHTVRNQDWMRQLTADAGAADHAEAAMEAAIDSVNHGTAKTETARAAAQQALQSALASVQNHLLRDKINSDLQNLDERFHYAQEENDREDSIVNKPAATWTATDLDGQKHSLEDYRGKVVALDFWYRGCGWCMVAMPQIKALADQFHDQPVVILGMNVDQNDQDAKFVVNKMQLNYLTLHATGIPEKYGVQGFPTFIVIDQKGIVRAQHIGYSPTLREEMAQSISNILSSNE
ncbi:MAG TPA: TlpA disulfide reductase family protein [Verrucomicrobiae bacterium]|nr:TlpA disulfide reductase family protein [Verrucomicrobiae bacterium]